MYMPEIRNIICTVCPIGCSIEVAIQNKEVESIKGQGCKRGEAYAVSESINPVRTLTTTVKVADGTLPLVPARSKKPLPKGLLLECMKVVNLIQLKAPVKIGDVIIPNILDTGVDIVATRDVGQA